MVDGEDANPKVFGDCKPCRTPFLPHSLIGRGRPAIQFPYVATRCMPDPTRKQGVRSTSDQWDNGACALHQSALLA